MWRWKEWIDRRWMRGYQVLPASMAELEPGDAAAPADDALPAISALAMRCGGCGSKVGSAILTRVLARLPREQRQDVLIGLDAPDDAAVVAVPAGHVMVHTVDFFRALVDDAYTFGAIAAHHSLSDIYAMGARPQSALAIATLPLAPEAKMEQQLYELLAGALTALADGGASLVGGHTTEGTEARVRPRGERARRAGAAAAQIGAASRRAAHPHQAARHRDAVRRRHARQGEGALGRGGHRHDAEPNRQAAECLRRYGARACTDVTGFGLLGHLLEMTKASGIDAEIALDALPALPGARETLAAGITSTLAPENVRLRRAIRNLEDAARHPLYPLLYDPQTSGGLLASVPAERADSCVRALRGLGYAEAAIVGTVRPASDSPEPITLLY